MFLSPSSKCLGVRCPLTPSPFPADADNTPFCPQHATCKKVWIEKWFLTLGHHIHHPSKDFPLILIPEALKNIDHRGMNPECKQYILEWIDTTLLYLICKEEDLIQEAVTTVLACLAFSLQWSSLVFEN